MPPLLKAARRSKDVCRLCRPWRHQSENASWLSAAHQRSSVFVQGEAGTPLKKWTIYQIGWDNTRMKACKQVLSPMLTVKTQMGSSQSKLMALKMPTFRTWTSVAWSKVVHLCYSTPLRKIWNTSRWIVVTSRRRGTQMVACNCSSDKTFVGMLFHPRALNSTTISTFRSVVPLQLVALSSKALAKTSDEIKFARSWRTAWKRTSRGNLV